MQQVDGGPGIGQLCCKIGRHRALKPQATDLNATQMESRNPLRKEHLARLIGWHGQLQFTVGGVDQALAQPHEIRQQLPWQGQA